MNNIVMAKWAKLWNVCIQLLVWTDNRRTRDVRTLSRGLLKIQKPVITTLLMRLLYFSTYLGQGTRRPPLFKCVTKTQ